MPISSYGWNRSISFLLAVPLCISGLKNLFCKPLILKFVNQKEALRYLVWFDMGA
ncbi:unknown protein [Microcystis aeruginosa NIES-843]|uniref:Uncharacterized protein n=1 Tax=Microcystis aeruginosa (strain NIES-843 / IAM M-2473) TaxID=449447 RepID=B0JV96_MICAN|nr:unknown protein [Microcystis aeruginosa NIES-843]